MKLKRVPIVEYPCRGERTKLISAINMTLNNTNPSDLSTLDEPSLQTLIDHYLSVREKLPENVSVRDRLIELQDELLNRQLNNEE